LKDYPNLPLQLPVDAPFSFSSPLHTPLFIKSFEASYFESLRRKKLALREQRARWEKRWAVWYDYGPTETWEM